VLYQFRPDTPRHDSHGRPIKYETQKSAAMRLDFGTGQRELIADPRVPLWTSEGAKKLDALSTHHFCAIGLLGVWNWRGRNSVDGLMALADWEDVALNGRAVYVCFDSDITTKAPVQAALKRFRGFLANRGAQPHVVYLPPDGEAKVGVDDYLVAHSADELRALADGQNSPNGGPDAVAEGPTCLYRATDRGLQWRKVTRDGGVWVPLTNFTAKIVSDIKRDDGAETTREFEVKVSLQDHSFRFIMPAAHFPAMNWPTEHLGAQAIVYAGQALKDHTRVAIQALSEVIMQRRIFTHTGWRRNRDGEWYFFHAGGVLGVNGHVANMEVALPSELQRLIFPEPPAGDNCHVAIQTSLRLLEVAPDHVIVPVSASIYRAVLGEADIGVHLSGPTGSGKTELAALAQQHFGAGFDARHLPGSWLSTGNALEALAFAAKDILLVVDDFAPGGAAADVARMHREADRVFRAQGNQAGRARLRPDGTMRPSKRPRGLILSTGEEVPRGQSLRARLLIVEVSPDDVDWERLADCQSDAAQGRYAQAMAAYLQWRRDTRSYALNCPAAWRSCNGPPIAVDSIGGR
jgi:Domain of unknown function (DUF3854)/Domain of unknown function (DUF927)